MIKKLSFSDIEKLYSLVAKDYLVYSPTEHQGSVALELKEKFNRFTLHKYQTVLPAKKVLLENVYDIETVGAKQQIALFGLHLCDVKAISILSKTFKKDPHFQAKAKELFIIATDCKPTESCFCHVFGANAHVGFDLFIQEESDGNFLVFAKTEKGVEYLRRIKAPLKMNSTYRPIGHSDKTIDLTELKQAISDRELFEEYWQGIANNCFGCGACTAVCPLCFCFDVIDRTDPKNGKCHRTRKADSCFFANFSKISNFDFRPENVDRLYNWYHHKFVRGPKETGDFLCTGCGRCITACPANLNIIKILSALDTVFDRATGR